jgi:hypothetical protein
MTARLSFAISLVASAMMAGSAAAAGPGTTVCAARSANVLQYTSTTFATACYVRSAGTPVDFAAYLAPALGNMKGYTFDLTYYVVDSSGPAFLQGFAGSLQYDRACGRSYLTYPVSAGNEIGPVLANWVANPNDANVLKLMMRISVRDSSGCLVNTVDYTQLADFIPPAVLSDCSTLQ